MSGEVIAINAALLAVYDHTQCKNEAFVTSNRVEFELTHTSRSYIVGVRFHSKKESPVQKRSLHKQER